MAGIPLITSKSAPYHEIIARELSAAVDDKVPVTSDVACVLGACAALGWRDIVAASIYQRYIQDNMIGYFARYGVRTAADVALDYALADCMTQPTMTTARDTARAAWAKAPAADGLFIACPQWPVIDQIAPLEAETGRPVLTHLSAVLWGALAQIGVRAPVEGRGRLLAEWPTWQGVPSFA
jgi:maleate cis-trans isomerase